MKTITLQRLTHLTMIAAVLAAAVSVQPAHAAEAAPRVIQLPPVLVVAKRIPVLQLERVVVTAKRIAVAPTLIAQRGPRGVLAQGAGRV